MKIVKIMGAILGAVVLVAGLAWLLRSDPIGPISGRELSGDEVAYPEDWSFTDAHTTIAVETRPSDPHSITTVCFVHEGELYVPARGGSEKQWTQFVLADPRVRLKIDGRIYAVRATRVTDFQPEAVLASAGKKYEQMAERSPEEAPEDIWLFRISPREG